MGFPASDSGKREPTCLSVSKSSSPPKVQMILCLYRRPSLLDSSPISLGSEEMARLILLGKGEDSRTSALSILVAW